MPVNRKSSQHAPALAGGLALGVLCAIVVTAVSAAIFARLMSREVLQESALGYICVTILVLSSGVGAWVAAAKVKQKWMIVCILTAGCYFLFLLSCTALFFDGQYQGLGVTALAVLGAGGAVGLLGIRQPKGGRRRSPGKMYKKSMKRR